MSHGFNVGVGETRRAVLRRYGSLGLAATFGAGLTTLFRGRPARAAAILPSPTQPPSAIIDGIPTFGQMGPDTCCTICNEAQHQCDPSGHCATGQCCYYCNGCGLGGYYCIASGGCQYTQVRICT